jgi:hypothetical protein
MYRNMGDIWYSAKISQTNIIEVDSNLYDMVSVKN